MTMLLLASSHLSRRHRPILRPLSQRHISVGDLLHKLHVRVVKHDVEVLDRVHRLEGLPVLEPDDLFADIHQFSLLLHC